MEMKKLGLLYNPCAGDKSMPGKLDSVIEVLQNGGYLVQPFRLPSISAIDEYISQLSPEISALAVSGGDGTINYAVNSMLANNINLPLGIIPSGTANDFASFLNIPSDPVRAAELIAHGETIKVDLGKVNGRYFVNVCAAGALASVSQSIDLNLKNNLGKIAYYLKGIELLRSIEPMRMRITGSTFAEEHDLCLFLVLNSSGTGGFHELAPTASVVDGKLEFVGIRAKPLGEIAVLFMKMLAQPKEYLDDTNVVFLQDSYFKIEQLYDNGNVNYTDVDGECGPCLPVEINIEPQAVRIFI